MRILMAACLAILASCSAPATAEPIAVSEAWAAPTPAGVTVGAAYATITNTQNTPDTLVSAESARAGRVEVHEMRMDAGVMRMRRVEALIVPADGAVAMAPGGLHLMLYDLSSPLTAGETIQIRLRFARAGEVEAAFTVRARGSAHAGH
jgi:periplasmic copper chaperone A